MKRKKYVISSFSKRTKYLIDRTIINLELDKAVKLARVKLNKKDKKDPKNENYENKWQVFAIKIIKKYNLPINLIGPIMEWIESGKQPKIDFSTEIKMELSSWKDGDGYVSKIPEFSYITISAPLYSDPQEIKDLFEEGQRKLVSSMKPYSKWIRPVNDDKLRFKIVKLCLNGKKPKEIFSIINKNSSQPISMKKINQMIGNYKKEDPKFLNRK